MGSGGGIFGGIGSVLFGDGGASAQADAANNATAASLEATKLALAQQDKMYQDTRALQKPMYDLGLSAVGQAFGGQDANGNYYFDPSKLNQYTVNNPFQYQDYKAQQFDPNSVNALNDPSYQFRLQQGVNALDKSAAARGNLLSGAQQKAVQQYGQDMASQEYQNAYNRALQTNQTNNTTGLQQYQQNQGNALTSYNSNVNLGTQRYNQLASVLGLGQTSANALQQNNTNAANAYTQTQMQNASNIASAEAYKGNALASAGRWTAQQGYNAFGDGAKFLAGQGII